MDSTATRRTVLVVDDHDPWRRQVLSLLEKSGVWEVCGEASDGVDALAKVSALRPALTVLDVELPRMTGIETARRIVANDPDAKILFLSGHSNLDIVSGTFAAGGRGYVLKTDAGHELLAAMDAVLAGKRFLGALVTGRGRDAVVEDAQPSPHRHEMGLYADSGQVVEGLAGFAEKALESGKSVIVVIAAARADQLVERLRAAGVEIDAAIRQGRYRQVDVERALPQYMVNGRPDEMLFWKTATAMVIESAKASSGPGRVALCGEGTGHLFNENPEVALQVERWWDELAAAYNVDVYCAHQIHGAMSPALKMICACHTKVHSG